MILAEAFPQPETRMLALKIFFITFGSFVAWKLGVFLHKIWRLAPSQILLAALLGLVVAVIIIATWKVPRVRRQAPL